MVYSRQFLQLSRYYSSGALAQTRSPKFAKDFQRFYPKLVDSALAKTKYLENEEVKGLIKKYILDIKLITEYYTLVKYPLQTEYQLYCYHLIENPEAVNERKLHQVYTLGCLLETFQALYIITDDIFDGAKMRANVPCWHLLPGTSRLCINDVSLMRSFMNEIIKQTIDEKYYAKIMDIFNEMFSNLEISQYLDMVYEKSRDYDKFTLSNYDLLQTCKASYYCVMAPLNIALVLSDKANEESFRLIEDLCTNLGVLVQVHNDFTDYVDADNSFSKKCSTDIQAGKCSWSAVIALRNFNAEQRKIFDQNFRSWDPECVNRIRKLYKEINLPELYVKECQTRYDIYTRKVNNLPKHVTPSPEVFLNVLDFIRAHVDNVQEYYYK